MFIELHQTKDGLGIRVNVDHIQVYTQGFDADFTNIFFDSDHWLEVIESYEEIAEMLEEN